MALRRPAGRDNRKPPGYAWLPFGPVRTGYGAANRTRTCDPVITNDVLYQLSYCGEPSVPLRSVFLGLKRYFQPSGSLENART